MRAEPVAAWGSEGAQMSIEDDCIVTSGLLSWTKKGEHDLHGWLVIPMDVCAKCGLSRRNIINDKIDVCTGPDVNDPASFVRRQLAKMTLDTINPAGHA